VAARRRRSSQEVARLRRALAIAEEAAEQLRVQNEHLVEAKALLEDVGDRYADLYDFAPLGLLTLDAAGMIRELNLKAASMLGVERPRALRLPLAAFVADSRALRRHLTESRQAAGTAVCEAELRPPGRPAAIVEVLTRRAATGGGTLRTALIDVTERKRLVASEQAMQAEREARDTFVAMVSHELRTPLAPIVAAASALRQGRQSSRRIERLSSLIERNAVLQGRLVDDLLDANRIVRKKMSLDRRPTELHQIAREVVEMFADELRDKRLTMTVDLRATETTVDGDATRLRQVLWNLVKNAIKFTPARGQIALRSWGGGGRATRHRGERLRGRVERRADREVVRALPAGRERRPRRAGSGPRDRSRHRGASRRSPHRQ
jgi:signal transduction histidine kinase